MVRAIVWRHAFWALLLLAGVSACGGSTPAQADHRSAAVYEAIIGTLADRSAGADLPQVFVTSRPGVAPIPLEVQAKVVNDLRPELTVRFVDSDDEAIDETSPDRAVSHGVLLRIGSLTSDGRVATVQVERYRNVSDQRLVTLSVTGSGDDRVATVTAEVPFQPA